MDRSGELVVEGKTRLINIRYLNSIPYRVLGSDPTIDYREGLPIECASALLQKDVEVGLLPLASIFKHGLYNILPYGIIANGPVESAFLFSRVELNELESISIDSTSETSVILLKTIIAEFYPELSKRIKYRVENPGKVLDSISKRNGGFLISDHGLKNSSRFTHTLDLSAEWKKQTGSPFLFAAWAYRPGSITTDQIDNFTKNVEIGLEYRGLYARDWADTQGISREVAMRYVGKVITYSITQEVREAASEFIRRASSHNFLPGELAEVVKNPVIRKVTGSPLSNSKSLAPIEVVTFEAKSGRRLSIGSALQLVQSLSLSELAEVTNESRARDTEQEISLYHLNLSSDVVTDSDPRSSTYELEPLQLSPDEILTRVSRVPENSVVLLESIDFNEFTLEYVEDLVRQLRKANQVTTLGALSVEELTRVASETTLELPEVLTRLKHAGLNLIGGITSGLLGTLKTQIQPIKYLEIQRTIFDLGLGTLTNLRVTPEATLSDYAVHLFHIRQLQDQTGSIKMHFVDARSSGSKMYAERTSPSWYFRAFCLSKLILDNISSVAISPTVYGTPVAQVLSALHGSKNVYSASNYKGVVTEL